MNNYFQPFADQTKKTLIFVKHVKLKQWKHGHDLVDFLTRVKTQF
jgi:hypothetical protein